MLSVNVATLCTDVANRRQDVSVLPPGVARSGHRVAMLTNGGYQTMPGNRRTTGVGQQNTAVDYAYQEQPYNYRHQHQQQKRREDATDARACARFNSVTLPRRDVIETGTGNSRSAVAFGSPATGRGGRGRPRLTPAVSDADLSGGAAHHSPRGGATGDDRRLAAAHANHVGAGGIISKSLLALPDTAL